MRKPHPRPVGRLFRDCHTSQGTGLALGLGSEVGDYGWGWDERGQRRFGRDITSAHSGAGPYPDVRQLRSRRQFCDGLPYRPGLRLRLCGELGVLIFFFLFF